MLVGLVGCGGFGREVMPILTEWLAKRERFASLVFVETTSVSRKSINGFPVVSAEQFLNDKRERYFNIAIANSQVRADIASSFIEKGAKPIDILSRRATVYSNNEIGSGSIICSDCIVTSNARIGSFFHCNIYSYVAHDCVIGDFVTFAPRVSCNGNVVIEDHAYVGTGAIIREGSRERPLRIGKGAIIGMGAVITKDVPPGETWIGNPGKQLQRS